MPPRTQPIRQYSTIAPHFTLITQSIDKFTMQTHKVIIKQLFLKFTIYTNS